MGRFENQPNPQSNGEASSDAGTMRALIEELQTLQQSVLKSLQEDIKRLQNEKHRLAEDIQQLQVKKNNLQHEQLEAEQQVLIRQLVQVLANHVSVELKSTLENLFESAMLKQQAIPSNNADSTQSVHADTEQVLASLKNTLASTFEQLQADFKILPVGVADAGAWHYSHIYNITARHFPQLVEQARFINENAARKKILSLYFESVGSNS